MELTAKQVTFCKSYLFSRDAKAAALEAGYSESYASKKAYALVKQKNISKKIDELEAEHFNKSFAKLAVKGLEVLGEILDSEILDERVTLAAIKEVFKYNRLEQKLNIADKKEDTHLNITFNEVASRDT